MSLLEIQNVSKAFPLEGGIFRRNAGSVQALRNVSLAIDSGQTVAVVGGSGSGKSTLAKLIVGLLAPDEGTILWEGQLLTSFSRLQRAQRVQMIFQDPYASLNPKLSVEMQLREVVRLSSSPTRGEGVRGRCIQLLEAVGLGPEALGHYPFQFSGGQRQRIAIARGLAAGPRLLIADEPLSALDVTTQAQILDLFTQLQKDLGLTFLFITHDLGVAQRFADQVVVLQEGQVVEAGPASAVLRHPQHPYTQALLEAVPRIAC